MSEKVIIIMPREKARMSPVVLGWKWRSKVRVLGYTEKCSCVYMCTYSLVLSAEGA